MGAAGHRPENAVSRYHRLYFEFGFSDSLLQMFAAFVSELRGLPCSFGCFTPAEAHLSHRVLTAALESYTQKRVVTLE